MGHTLKIGQTLKKRIPLTKIGHTRKTGDTLKTIDNTWKANKNMSHTLKTGSHLENFFALG